MSHRHGDAIGGDDRHDGQDAAVERGDAARRAAPSASDRSHWGQNPRSAASGDHDVQSCMGRSERRLHQRWRIAPG